MSDLVARYVNGEPVVAILKDAQDRIAKLEEFQRYHSMPGVCDCPHCMKLMEATDDE